MSLAGEITKLLLSQARQWCRGRYWQLRLVLLFFLLDNLVRHLRDPLYQSIFKGLDLGLHEMGHYLFAPLGQFLQIAGGSIFQCLVPLLSIIMFYRQRDFFAIAVCFGWLADNLYDVAAYMADARLQQLQLVSPRGGDEIIHDWNYILSTLHLETLDFTLAAITRVIAVIVSLIGLGFGSWLLWNMFTLNEPEST